MSGLPKELGVADALERFGEAVRGLDWALAVANGAAVRSALHALKSFLSHEKLFVGPSAPRLLTADVRGLLESLLLRRLPAESDPVLFHKLLRATTLLLRKVWQQQNLANITQSSKEASGEWEVPWRAVYEILRSHLPHTAPPDSPLSTKWPTPNFSNTSLRSPAPLIGLVKAARRFFGRGAVGEVWAEFLPGLQALDSTDFFQALLFLNAFLPTQHGTEVALWVERVVGVWGWVENSSLWAQALLHLLARAAKATQSLASQLWTPERVALIYSRYLATLDLATAGAGPGVASAGRRSSPPHLKPWKRLLPPLSRSFARWVVFASSGASGAVVAGFGGLAGVVGTFLHPSNHGPWAPSLAALLASLTHALNKRVGVARLGGTDGPGFGAETLVRHALPLALSALFARNYSVSSYATKALRSMALLYPAEVWAAVGPRIAATLPDPSHAHQTPAMLDLVAQLMPALIASPDVPDFARELESLLKQAVEAIDVNDAFKTLAGLRVVLAFAGAVPLGWDNAASAIALAPNGRQLSEVEVVQRESRYGANEWVGEWAESVVSQFLRFWALLDAPAKSPSFHDRLTLHLSRRVWRQLFQQAHPALGRRLGAQVLRALRDGPLPHARAHTAAALKSAILSNPGLLELVFEEGKMLQGLVAAPTGPSPLANASPLALWRLHLLAAAVRYGGKELALRYGTQLSAVVATAVAQGASAAARKAGAKILRSALAGAVQYYPVDYRHLSPPQWEQLAQSGGISLAWGPQDSAPGVDASAVRWHCPSSEEMKFAAELASKFSAAALAECEAHRPGASPDLPKASSSPPTTRTELRGALGVLKAVLRGGGALLRPLLADVEESPLPRPFDPTDPTGDATQSIDPNEWEDAFSDTFVAQGGPVLERGGLAVVREGWWNEVAAIDQALPGSPDSLASLRSQIARVLVELFDGALSEGVSDYRHLKALAKLALAATVDHRGLGLPAIKVHRRATLYALFTTAHASSVKGLTHPTAQERWLRVERAEVGFLRRRAGLVWTAQPTAADRALTQAFLRTAQLSHEVFKWMHGPVVEMLKFLPASTRGLLGQLFQTLATPAADPTGLERIKVAAAIVSSPWVLTRVTRSWGLMGRFVRSLIDCHRHADVDLQASFHLLFLHFATRLYPLPLLATPPDLVTELTGSEVSALGRALPAEAIARASSVARGRNARNLHASRQVRALFTATLSSSSAAAASAAEGVGAVNWRWRLLGAVGLAALTRGPEALAPLLDLPSSFAASTNPLAAFLPSPGPKSGPLPTLGDLWAVEAQARLFLSGLLDPVPALRTASKVGLIALVRAWKKPKGSGGVRAAVVETQRSLGALIGHFLSDLARLERLLEQLSQDHTAVAKEDKDQTPHKGHALFGRLAALGQFSQVDLQSLLGPGEGHKSASDAQGVLEAMVRPLHAWTRSALHGSLSPSASPLALSPHDHREELSLLNVQLWKALALVASNRWAPNATEAQSAHFVALVSWARSRVGATLASAEAAQSLHTAVAELSVALARVDPSAADLFGPVVFAPLSRLLVDAPWTPALALLAAHRSPAQLPALHHWAVSSVSGLASSGQSGGEAWERALKFSFALLREFAQTGLPVAREVSKKLAEGGEVGSWALVGPSSSLVRRAMADHLALLASLEFDPASLRAGTQGEQVHEGSLAAHIRAVGALRLADAPADPSVAERIKSALLERLLLLISSHVAQAAVLPHLEQVVPVVVGLTSEGREDVRNLALTAWTKLAQLFLPPHALTRDSPPRPLLRTTVETLMSLTGEASRPWKERSLVFPFLQVLVFNHRYLLSSGEVDSVVGRVAEVLLTDAQPEVRDSARRCLTSVVKSCDGRGGERCGPLTEKFSAQFLAHLKKAAAQLTATKGQPEFAGHLRRMHGAVLGLVALAETEPYTVPPWLPPLALAVALHHNAPSPIRATVSQFLQDFVRTHSGNGYDLADHFSASQLDLIRQRSVPSYFA